MARRRRRRAPVYDPLAALSPRAQRRLVTQTVNSQIVPLIAQVNAGINRQERSGQGAIAGYTNALVRDLSPLASQTRATYGAAEQRQTLDDTALANRLAGLGGETAAALRAQLGGSVGAEQLASLTGEATQQGGGAGATVAALGTAARGALRGAGAAAEAYSGQLPGIARVGGVQRISQLIGQLENARQTQVGDIRSKVPGLLAQVSSDVRNQEFQKAVAAASGLVDQEKLQLDTAYKTAKLGQGQAALNLRAAKQRSDALFKQAGVNLGRDRYNLAVQAEHRLERTKKGKKGGYTPGQLSKLRATAIESAKDYKHGFPPTHYANGGVKTRGAPPHPNIAAARDLFRALVNHGIPPSMADWATGQVYGGWRAPGERRRRGPGGTGPR